MEIRTLTDILKNSVALYPHNEAFKCGDISLSYQELDLKTSQLAQCLIDSGVKKGDRVGVYLNRCIETVIAIYGILKSGAVYVPLDFTAPHPRTRTLIDNCDIKILITSDKQKKRIAALCETKSQLEYIIGLSQEQSIKTLSWDLVFTTEIDAYKPPMIHEDDLAYIMFTSGSTGAPKGIMHTHFSGLSYAKFSSELYSVNANDRVGNHAPINFDISTFGYFSAPLAGATTIIATDAHTKFPVSLAHLIENEKLTIWYSVPLALTQILLSGVLETLQLKSLRWVLFGGEVFGLKYLKEFMEKLPDATFSNVYGPAEVNQCTFHHMDASSNLGGYLPIGKVWFDAEFKILDSEDKEVVKGEKGLLVIKVDTMMKGYWNNEELTQRSFFRVNDHINGDKIYYRTGDVVFENEHDDLMFLGRNDRQKKIRGFRIELDEIESVLLNHYAVEEASVLIIGSDDNEKEICAFTILLPNTTITKYEFLSHCKSLLPTYAVPDQIQIVNDFPRTSSGKIDRNVLMNNLTEK